MMIKQYLLASTSSSRLVLIARASLQRSYSTKRPSQRQPHESPLKGIKILDLSRILAGPSAAQLLGDLGADVIKIEEPDRGDDTRWLKTQYEQRQDPQVFKPSSTLSNYFLSCNRNKKSLTLNLKKPDGVQILKKLIAQSDVLIENFIVGKMEQLGLGYDTLREINPRIIYSSISGYGTTGPKAKAAGYDVIAAAESGFMSITGELDRPPMKTGVAICDIVTGLHAAIGILASLYSRDGGPDGGRLGQKVESSLFESALSLSFNVGSSFLNSGEEAQRWGTSHPSIVPYQAFEAQDAYMIIGTTNNKQFEKLCNILELEELKSDPRFGTNSQRVENRVELVEILGERLKSRPASEWIEKLGNLGLPCSRINSIRQAFQQPQADVRQMIQEIDCEHSFSGKIHLIGTPIKLSESPLTIRSAPPVLGEHTKEILAQLGYTNEQVAQLVKDSVI
ncbi:hypothetical protein PTTG_12161 [Puccinia triticina 1-1 BBBD Race 1]|uniref:CoA-transferase family III n=2 Tax=Puccinia triticina TaxID=208348 RepID=A0A180GM85_PUCT1|nr:uncharacterized protein PtA15_2A758 [Puccinia triticina]OAV93917.1 hypothetical protein PTTG_12161 [Puccinia triticina 1-1 BBBD Race 1]WAQ82441.1 hypothetical protein PtA15_2A758 [Puccinia triticina]